MAPTDPISMAELASVHAHRGEISELGALLKSNPALLSTTDKFGRTVLHWAVAGGRTLTTKYLIGHWHADTLLAVQDESGDTPLHLFCGPMPILQLLHHGGLHTPPSDLQNAKGLKPIEAIAEANGYSPEDAVIGLGRALKLPLKTDEATTTTFSFLRESPARVVPSRTRPRVWPTRLTTSSAVCGLTPLLLILSLGVLPFHISGSLLLITLFVILVCALVDYKWTARTLSKLWSYLDNNDPTLAVLVLLTLLTLLFLQNWLGMATAFAVAPKLAACHLVCQAAALYSYLLTVTLDPSFVPGGEEADAKAYWELLEKPLAEHGGVKAGEEGPANDDGDEGRAAPLLKAAFCPRSEMLRIRRAKFSPYCKGLVRTFDHDCSFLGVAIGDGNHRAFIVFLGTAVTSIAGGIIFAVSSPPKWVALGMHPLQQRLWALGVVWGLCVLFPLAVLFYSQCKLIGANVTTVEEQKWCRANPHRYWVPGRDEHGWEGFAPHDKGSCFANNRAFWMRSR